MLFSQILSPDHVCIDSTAQSKTAVLLKISQLLSQYQPALEVESLFDALWRRDSLGSTAIGNGIIIPHIRTTAIDKTVGCFLKLQNPVDFAADDKQPIDLVVGLVVPQAQPTQHLQLLKDIINRFNCPEFRLACRNATNSLTLYHLLCQDNVAKIHQPETADA